MVKSAVIQLSTQSWTTMVKHVLKIIVKKNYSVYFCYVVEISVSNCRSVVL